MGGEKTNTLRGRYGRGEGNYTEGKVRKGRRQLHLGEGTEGEKATTLRGRYGRGEGKYT